MSEKRDWRIEFDLFDVTDEEAEAAFDRCGDVICGEEHGPDDKCSLLFVGGLHPAPSPTEENEG